MINTSIILDYFPSANGTFTALNQFGQVVDQNWTVSRSMIGPYAYDYDRNGNRRPIRPHETGRWRQH